MTNDCEVINLSSDDNEAFKFRFSDKTENSNKGRDKDDYISITSSDSEISENNFHDIHINIGAEEPDGNVSDVNTGAKVKWNKVISPLGWTKSMRRYYNKPSRRQRYFDWKKELNEIRLERQTKWHILQEDIYPIEIRKKRCLICRQTDHLSWKCPRRDGTCIMCGTTGHLMYRCPRKICLNCGAPSSSYTNQCNNCIHEKNVKCNGCKKYGHKMKNCPDEWRRYHRTTVSKELSNAPIEINKNIHCSNCAKRGHGYDECKEGTSRTGFDATTSQPKNSRGTKRPRRSKDSNSDSHHGSKRIKLDRSSDSASMNSDNYPNFLRNLEMERKRKNKKKKKKKKPKHIFISE